MRSSANPFVLAFALSPILSGCIDETRIREMVERNQAEAARQYPIRKARLLQELANRAPCCDDLALVRPAARLTTERAYNATIGVWPNDQIAEFDGFRSYYAMLALDGPADTGRRVTVRLTPSLVPFADPVTKQPAKEFFIPAITFLDSNRARLATVNTTPTAVSGTAELAAIETVPLGTEFIVLHSSNEILNAPANSEVLGSGHAIYPIGPVVVMISAPPTPIIAMPAVTGTVRVIIN